MNHKERAPLPFWFMGGMLLLCCAFLSSPVRAEVSAQAAILIEADSGDVIYEKNAHEKRPMASTTKIMTAVVALEHSKPDQVVSVKEAACGVEGSSIYLTPGEQLTMEELLYALMLESANDAAAAIAYEIAGGIDGFAALMNETAARIGLGETHFTNPHGLDHEEHYTTAADLAKLTAYAMRIPTFREIVSTYKRAIPLRNGDRNGEETRMLLNHNRLLRRSEDVIGVKTGFTKRSGRCLVTAAERNGVKVIAVTLNAPDDWNDHLALHELGFAQYASYVLAEPGSFSGRFLCASAPDGSVLAANDEGLTLCLKAGLTITHTVECGRMLFAPIEKGDVLGRVVFYADGEEIGSVPLTAQESVEAPADGRSLGEKILDRFR